MSRWPIQQNSWRREDQILTAALKVGLVAGVLAVELIVIAAFAYLMLEAVR